MEILSGFKRVREQALPELNSAARFYRHAKTGAELLSLVNDDDNKVFGVTFRTPPRVDRISSTCGSAQTSTKRTGPRNRSVASVICGACISLLTDLKRAGRP